LNKFILNNKTVVLATHNKGKIEEFRSLFSGSKVKLKTSFDVGINDVKETGKTFEENSIIKAKSISDQYISISDDSGLSIEALNYKPGIFSARYASKKGGWQNAMKALYKEVLEKNTDNFNAKFECVISLKWYDQWIKTFYGSVKGKIVWPMKGNNGFGYDPFFIPSGHKNTFGEMIHSDKIMIDHRYVAFKKLAKAHLICN
tara:strand:+ start:278 stop:883 length:606 start_codon:yes stop_codon:yes gene_type:complete